MFKYYIAYMVREYSNQREHKKTVGEHHKTSTNTLKFEDLFCVWLNT
jgi:hypothetical protein